MVGTPQLRSQLQQAQNIKENETIRQGGKSYQSICSKYWDYPDHNR